MQHVSNASYWVGCKVAKGSFFGLGASIYIYIVYIYINTYTSNVWIEPTKTICLKLRICGPYIYNTYEKREWRQGGGVSVVMWCFTCLRGHAVYSFSWAGIICDFEKGPGKNVLFLTRKIKLLWDSSDGFTPACINFFRMRLCNF